MAIIFPIRLDLVWRIRLNGKVRGLIRTYRSDTQPSIRQATMLQFTFYYGKGFLNYRIFITGSLVFWTENRNRGDDYTKDLSGKKFVFIGDPQIWIRIIKGFSLGSRINVFYNLLDDNNQIKVYPTIGAKYEF